MRGTAVAGNTVAVTGSTNQATCTATAATDGTWSCALTDLSPGQQALSATQSDKAGATSKPSAIVLVYVGTPPATARLKDTDPSIVYNSWDYLGSRGYGDHDDDVHYATTDGSSIRYTFIGTGIKVFGEKYTDQGNIGVSIDGGPATVVDTVPTDGARHTDVAVYTNIALAAGVHTIVVTKLSGTYATFDGFEIDNPASQ
ncbi:Ig-like domain-containing protein [Streptomyces avermitilis]|uniref:Ig-like domain-containing protein n=1 Tax=Streptomyces avermitilis TaxID=33903 RepID=UPI00117D53AE|nr:Ig-like domain-containing protein [Streptomyces avermitilis]